MGPRICHAADLMGVGFVEELHDEHDACFFAGPDVDFFLGVCHEASGVPVVDDALDWPTGTVFQLVVCLGEDVTTFQGHRKSLLFIEIFLKIDLLFELLNLPPEHTRLLELLFIIDNHLL